MNKVVRLPNGRFITRKVVESDPRELARAKPEEIWTMADGRSNSGKTQYTRDILIRDMETSHIVNALRILTQQAFTKMRMIGALAALPGVTSMEHVEKLLAQQPSLCDQVIAFAEKTMPHYRVMRDELDRRLSGKSEPEKIAEHSSRKFDF